MTSALPPTVPEVRGVWLAFAVIVVYALAYPLLSPGLDDVPLAMLYPLLLVALAPVWMFTRRLTTWGVRVAHGTSGPADLRGIQRWRSAGLAMGVVLVLGGLGDLSGVPWRGVGSMLAALPTLAFAWLSGPVIVAVQATSTGTPDAAARLAALLPRWTLAGRALQVALVAYTFVAEPTYTVPLFLLTLAVGIAEAVTIEALLRFARARV